jgi:hypothetical protein
MTYFKSLALTGFAAFSLSAAALAQTYGSGEAAPKPAATSTNAAVTALASGPFSGRSDHVTTGTATLVKTDRGYKVVLSGDFELDGAPDPVVAVGNGERYSPSNKLGALKNRTGAQSYELPANITPANFSQVYIWCEKFSVPLGVATLGPKVKAKTGRKYGS